MKKLLSLLAACLLIILSGCAKTQTTASLNDYLEPNVPMSYTEFWLFPTKESLVQCTVNQYRSDSASTLLFDDVYLLLSCTYSQEQYDRELSRLEDIGAVYRDDLFQYPAYVMIFYYGHYEYALLDTENNTVIYIAAQTTDFEGQSPDKALTDFPSKYYPVKLPQEDICVYQYE